MSRALILMLIAFLPSATACRGDTTTSVKPATQPSIDSVVEPAAKDIVVKDIEGTERKPFNCGPTHAKGSVLFFLSHDCPISNSYAPEINRICAAYGGDGKFVISIVHPFADLKDAEARKHAKEYGFTAPVMIDGTKVLTSRATVRITPEVAVLSPEGQVLYRGRIDDKWVGYGKGRPEPTVRDLRNALDAILAGKPVAVARTDAVGCPIE